MMNNETSMNTHVDMLVRGPSQRLLSSNALGWDSIALERHIIAPSEKPEVETGHCVIELAVGPQVAYGERAFRPSQFKPYVKPPGTIYLHLNGSLPAIHPSTSTDLIVCRLDRRFVTTVAEELQGERLVTTREQDGIVYRDDVISTLLKSLEREIRSGGCTGRLYVDHLAYALTIRILTHRQDTGDRGKSNKLPPHRLRRVVERMEAGLSDKLDLDTLARESGYSRNHFLRMFRSATGFTPYQFLLNLRVERAQALMKNRSMNLLDIALECGFSSQKDLSRVFRHVTGIAPSEFRRDLLATTPGAEKAA